eukprot:6209667-Pleurochrysis_carterae.AAC.1
MPLCAVDSNGRITRLVLRNVRCVPTFGDLSVNQLWESFSTECVFGTKLAIVSPPASDGSRSTLPFVRRSGLYEWHVTTRPICPQPTGRTQEAAH